MFPSHDHGVAKGKIEVIKTYLDNVVDAEYAKNWQLFCTNLVSMNTAVNDLDSYINSPANIDTLKSEQTYENNYQAVAAYRDTIALKKAVHTCAEFRSPVSESFTAKVLSITDGDTVEIDTNADNVADYTVRLLGINAPEGSTQKYLVRRLGCFAKCDEERWFANKEVYDDAVKELTKYWHSSLVFKTDLKRQFDGNDRLRS